MLNIPQAVIALSEYLSDSLVSKDLAAQVISFAQDKSRWLNAHGMFDNIRSQHISYCKKSGIASCPDYEFLELCVKSLFNLVNRSAPFDPDSQYCLPLYALRLANEKPGKSTAEVVRILLELEVG